MNRSRHIFELWSTIVDIVGPVGNWPKHIRPLFWKKDIKDKERFKLSVFIYVNGVNPELFYEWIHAIKILNPKNKSGWAHIRYLFKIMEEGREKRRTWYAWNVHENRSQYLKFRTLKKDTILNMIIVFDSRFSALPVYRGFRHRVFSKSRYLV